MKQLNKRRILLEMVFASDAPVAVIVKKGPSHWRQLFLWNTEADTFISGQWIRGDVSFCDLSPNGELFTYSVKTYIKQDFDHKWLLKHRSNSINDAEEGWTAISKPPYFTALALWPSAGPSAGPNSAGGYFDTDDTYILNFPKKHSAPLSGREPSGLNVIIANCNEEFTREPPHRRGWDITDPHSWSGTKFDRTGKYRIVKKYVGSSDGQSSGHYDFQLVDAGGMSIHDFGTCGDMDWDHQNRLVLTVSGKVLTAKIGTGSELTLKELADFTEGESEKVDSPEWAKTW